jgi:prepilin-type N-terminal cleavage/methylation domain-containing protein
MSGTATDRRPRTPHGRWTPACRPLSTGAPGTASLRHQVQRGGTEAGYARTCDDGFTLLETLVSFVLFAIVATAATYALVTGVTTRKATSDRIDATSIAEQQTARVRTMPQAQLTATPTTTTRATVGSTTYTVTRTVGYVPAGTPCPAAGAAPDSTVHEIAVSVVVTVPGSGRQVEMDSRLAC